jgi:hypothetical protein
VRATGLSLGSIWLFEDTYIKAQKFPLKEVLDHLVVIEQRLFLKANATLKFAVLGFWDLPILIIKMFVKLIVLKLHLQNRGF